MNTVKCRCCGKDVEIPVDNETFFELTHHREIGKPVAEIAPNLSADLREMFISATCPECWDKLWGNEDEE